MLEILHKSIVKPNNDVSVEGQPRPNEDAIKVRETSLSLSDGAGGVGVFAADWANYLVDSLPGSPIKNVDDLSEWIGSIWEPFYERNLERAEKDPFLLKKYESEGSLATLCAFWFDNHTLDFMTYGDSMVFLYDRKSKSLVTQSWFHDYYRLRQSPYLLNWKDENIDPSSFCTGRWILSKDKVAIVASDSLAQFLYTYYLCANPDTRNAVLEEIKIPSKLSDIIDKLKDCPLGSFDNVLIGLSEALKSENDDAFEQLLYALNSNQMLERDDYSLVIVELKEHE